MPESLLGQGEADAEVTAPIRTVRHWNTVPENERLKPHLYSVAGERYQRVERMRRRCWAAVPYAIFTKGLLVPCTTKPVKDEQFCKKHLRLWKAQNEPNEFRDFAE